MTNNEALQITISTTELRMSIAYQNAEALRRASNALAMAQMPETSNDHAAIRLLIGTWERIAMFVQDFNGPQRRRFFRCHPVLMVWLTLEPAVNAIRENRQVGPRFAIEFENLAEQYRKWTQTKDGQEYRTQAQQVICALFA